ncbi:hypothetical protein ACFL2C_00585 [Patescibacteria group bacterium]
MTRIKTLMMSVVVMLLISIVPVAHAAEVEIVCNEGETSCDVTPSDIAPVFDDESFPEDDLKPGDEFTRQLTVTNNREEVCSFTIYNFVINEDTEVLPGQFFSQELFTEFSGDGSTTGEIRFSNLFLITPLYLGNVDPGETIPFDWRVRFDSSAGNEFQRAVLDFDFDWTFTCNEQEETVLNISKSNDTGGATKSIGDAVTYTIVVWTSGNSVDGVEVFDTPPDGFKYQPGSWTASSDLRGDLKTLGITTEPTYSSPGVWQLGNMGVGETVTLTYIADIQGHVDPGIYPDIAWTRGTFGGSLVLGNDTYDPQYFVGTEVKVDTSRLSGIDFGGQVLGASTELPATGSDTAITLGAIALIVVGGTSIVAGLVRRRARSG